MVIVPRFRRSYYHKVVLGGLLVLVIILLIAIIVISLGRTYYLIFLVQIKMKLTLMLYDS